MHNIFISHFDDRVLGKWGIATETLARSLGHTVWHIYSEAIQYSSTRKALSSRIPFSVQIECNNRKKIGRT
jgi:hypothetical protein